MRLFRIIPFLLLSLTALGQSSITVVTNVANLLALTPVTTRPVVQVLGQVTANDGLGRDVIWSAASSAATNTWAAGGPIARPYGSATGRWFTLTNTTFPPDLPLTGGTLTGNLQWNNTAVPGLRLNNLTTVQRDATTPTAGSLIWNTTTSRMNMFDGSLWNAGFVRLSGDTMTGALVNNAGVALTASAPNRIVQQWNNAAVAFNALEINITSDANLSSTFLDCYDDTARRFWVTSGGTVNATQFIASADAILLRDAAATFGQRNGAVAQTYNLYGTYTDASNYRRLRSTMSTAGAVTLASEGLGTGATGNTLALSQNGANVLSFDSSGNATVAGTVAIGGAAFKVLSNTGTYDAPSIAAGGTTTTTLTVTGATVGSPATVGLTTLTTQGLVIDAHVQALNTVLVVLVNPTASPVDLASGTLKVNCFLQ